jgi:hypothetical protein
VTIGNQENPLLLGRGGANVSIVAGVSLAGSGRTLASNADFPLTGGGLAYSPSLLLAELKSLKSNGRLLTDQELLQTGGWIPSPLSAISEAAAGQATAASPSGTVVDEAAAAAKAAAALRSAVRDFVGASAFDASAEAYADRVVVQATALGQAAAVLAEDKPPSRQFAKIAPGAQLTKLPEPRSATELPKSANGAVVAGSVNDKAAVRAALRETAFADAAGAALADYVATHLDAATRARLDVAVSPYAKELVAYVQARTGRSGLSVADALSAFGQLTPAEQLLRDQQVLFNELRTGGRAVLAPGGDRLAYLRGYDAMTAMFPDSAGTNAGLTMSSSQIKTQQGGDISLLTPSGSINVGDLGSAGSAKSPSEIGIVTVAGGNIRGAVRDNVLVNQSRILTLGTSGDVLLWASLGNIDAGLGAKTVVGAPAPVTTINDKGEVVVDTSGTFSGSGIAVLDAASTLDLYAPMGEINAGDAGIRAKGNANFGAEGFVGADNLAVGGSALGAPPPPPTSSVSVVPSSAGNSAAAIAARPADNGDDDDKRRKRRSRRRLWLDFLGFGSGD